MAELGKPYRFGAETGLIEMPISWSLDDHPHFEFMRTQATVVPGLQSARAVMQNWMDEFLYMKKTVDWGVLTYTMHPYVIGRGYRMLAFEDLIAKLAAEGAVFMTMEEAAAEARPRLLGGVATTTLSSRIAYGCVGPGAAGDWNVAARFGDGRRTFVASPRNMSSRIVSHVTSNSHH